MKAYVVVTEEIHDQETFDKYKAQVVASFEAFGGEFVTRGGNLTVYEGEWPMPRLVIIGFPSRETAEDWYQSPGYREILPLRLASSKGNFVLVDGMPD